MSVNINMLYSVFMKYAKYADMNLLVLCESFLTDYECIKGNDGPHRHLHRVNNLPAKVSVDADGCRRYEWRLHGNLHSFNDQPALIELRNELCSLRLLLNRVALVLKQADGSKKVLSFNSDEVKTIDGLKLIWYKHGIVHRDHSYAYICRGIMYSYNHGKRHSYNDFPALVKDDECKWYKNGMVHRDGDFPAYTTSKSSTWYKNGKRHRDGDDPAFIDFEENSYIWFKRGRAHRENDLPACVNDVEQVWMLNEKPYKRPNDQPNIVTANGSCFWVDENEEYHRTTGPAYMANHNGTWSNFWYLHGERLVIINNNFCFESDPECHPIDLSKY